MFGCHNAVTFETLADGHQFAQKMPPATAFGHEEIVKERGEAVYLGVNCYEYQSLSINFQQAPYVGGFLLLLR